VGDLFCGVREVGLVVLLQPFWFVCPKISEGLSVRERSTTVDTAVGNLGRKSVRDVGENRGWGNYKFIHQPGR
jgi:hypothetical protein